MSKMKFKGAPPIATDPGGFPDFLIFGFFGKCRFLEFSGGIWCLGGFAIDGKWLWASNGRILSPFRAFSPEGRGDGGTEGPPADLARSTAEGVGGLVKI